MRLDFILGVVAGLLVAGLIVWLLPLTIDGPIPIGVAGDSCAHPIDWSEAMLHLEEIKSVSGKVESTAYATGSNGKPTFLNVGNAYPNADRFTIIIWEDDRGNFPLPPEEFYAGKTICVTGAIEEYQGIAEIIITHPSQIEPLMDGATSVNDIPIAFPKSTSPTAFEVGTLNLAFFEDGDAFTCEWAAGKFPRTDEQIAALADYLESLDIEVLALQEIESEVALEQLVQTLPDNLKAIVSPQDNCQRVAYIYDSERFKVVSVEEVPELAVTDSLRSGLAVVFSDHDDEHSFLAVNVHLKCCRDGANTRVTQLKALNAWLMQWLDGHAVENVILMGDFNDPLHKMADNVSTLSEGLDLDLITDAIPNMTCSPQGRTFTDAIDHIIVSRGLANHFSGFVRMENFFLNDDLPMRESYSDHCLVWSQFDFGG